MAQRTWDTHGEVGFNIDTSMEHHWCFHVYIVKTRATRVSDSIFFKHQYITNPQVTPEILVLKAAAELTSALRGIAGDRDGRCIGKGQRTFCQISRVKSSTNDSERAAKCKSHSPSAASGSTTSKGGATDGTPSKGANPDGG
jgi:hypothetical protein